MSCSRATIPLRERLEDERHSAQDCQRRRRCERARIGKLFPNRASGIVGFAFFMETEMSARKVAELSFAVLLVAAAMAAMLIAAGPAHADAGFQRWVEQFRAVAAHNGISRSTFDLAFRGVTAPDPEVLEKARYQPEFTAPVWQYFDNRVNEQSIANGRKMARKWKPWLDHIESRFGVSRYVLLAIWSMETNYGEVLKNDEIMRSVVRSLATLAYADPGRAKFARTQLIAALKILQNGDIDVGHLSGSWAGAIDRKSVV